MINIRIQAPFIPLFKIKQLNFLYDSSIRHMHKDNHLQKVALKLEVNQNQK